MSTDHPTGMEPLQGLPPELAELDAEFSRISMEERQSFGPELRNLLGREWGNPSVPARPSWVRHALAASLAAVALVGLAVPPARASLVEGMQRIIHTLRGEEDSGGEATALDLILHEEAPPLDGTLRNAPAMDPPVVEVATGDGLPVDLPRFQPGLSTYPTLVDKEADRNAARRYYPEELQRGGVGGVVTLHLWVKEDGSVEFPQIGEGGTSGIPELDRAALQAGSSLRFRPAMRNGVPVATWVEFDLVFEPTPALLGTPAEPLALETPGIPEVEGWEPPGDWTEAVALPAPIRLEAQALLRGAMGDSREALEREFGPLEGILSGDPPAGASPVEWRARVIRELDRARSRDPENPAPYLALARIRRKQGLRNDAQLLFQRGLERATRDARPVSPRLVAELAWESGRIAGERWLGWRNLGELPAEALESGRCAAGSSPGGVVPAETLIAWNFTCPAVLQTIMEEAFIPREEGAEQRQAMLQAFVKAVEAYPAHVGANTEILLDLAAQEAWHQVLEGAIRFGWASQGHPNALLLEGLALHRLGRSEEAYDRFQAALAGLGPEKAAGFRRLDILIPELASESGSSVWRALDPILSTPVNEREVEHLARAGYALLRFGALEADAARVLVRYGPPRAIRAFGAGPGLRLELWDYGDGPDLVFHRPSTSRNGALTVEAEEYLEELAGYLPHWYGNRARPLYALPAQLVRFRGSREGSQEVKIHFRIPGEFRAAEGEALEVGVFLLGPGGFPVETLRWTVDPEQGEVDLLAPATPGVGEMVVELFDPASGMAAGARLPLAGAPAGISDLLLVEPVELGRGEVERMGAGLTPLASRESLPDRVGVFAELYGLPLGSVYTLRFDLVSRASGLELPLESLPVGQSVPGGEWTRRIPGAETAMELVTLDLSGVGAGSYVLRMIVDPEGGEPLIRELPVIRGMNPEEVDDPEDPGVSF